MLYDLLVNYGKIWNGINHSKEVGLAMRTKRLLVLCLVVALALGMFPGVGVAAQTDYVYVALGDSIPAGYGLAPGQSYVNRLWGMVSATEVYNLSVSGMDCAGLLQLLDDPGVKTKVAKANLITLTIGANDLLSILTGAIAQVTQGADIGLVLQDPEKLALVLSALDNPELAKAFADGVTGVSAALPQILGKALALNPKAVIIMTNAYNPYTGIVIPSPVPGAPSFDLGAYVEQMIVGLNTVYAATAANAGGSVRLANVYAPFKAAGTYVNASMTPPRISLDPHPNAAGQAAIASEIYALVKTNVPTGKRIIGFGQLLNKSPLYKKQGSGKLCTLVKGSYAAVYQWDGEYALVGYNKTFAYIKTSDLTLYALPQAKILKRAQIRYDAPIKPKASTSGARVGTAYKNSQFLVLGTKSGFAKVALKGGGVGYIHQSNLSYIK